MFCPQCGHMPGPEQLGRFVARIVGFIVLTALAIAAVAIVIMALYYLWPILVLGLIGYLVVRHKKKQASPDTTPRQPPAPEPPR